VVRFRCFDTFSVSVSIAISHLLVNSTNVTINWKIAIVFANT